ncbi:PAS domain-containing sensor histidine kinase [Rhodoferax lacus]|uniref:histidine kinase n=1 Tax=Rhodoferax lacus TaxID=2184758 RepID=A0A3E1R9H6_9BURK|nr:ATP-binding protein [Rhodoferax lacus]RFO95330.1 PAS domain-containing sensor histidine kinase [Rhodoferax lacus]
MARASTERSWLGQAAPWAAVIHTDDTREFSRIWQGFMTARLTLGLVLLAMQVTMMAIGTPHSKWLIGISLAYLASTLTTGLFGKPLFLGNSFNRHWIRLVGLDVLAYSSLQILQGNTVNYTPLFALPILLASVLGSLRLALGTAASVTMLLLGNTALAYLNGSVDTTVSLLQAALTGVGYFAIALLANQLSSRLSSEGMRVRSSQAAVNLQRQVNELVIESLPDGVLIVDRQGLVRAANPAAVQLLAPTPEQKGPVADLHREPAWQPLLELTHRSFAQGHGQQEDVTIRHAGQGPRRIHVSTRPTNPQDLGGESLCVLFLQDQRELEARMRTEKLASMGRMSTAVAHEIRNPLAAISQANALLEEDLTDPHHKKLTHMVGQNAQRLAQIVNDILNAARAQPQDGGQTPLLVNLNEAAGRVCREWSAQNTCEKRLQYLPEAQSITVQFEGDHLRRVLVNLLDNARRFASDTPGSIQVQTHSVPQHATLRVWSAGPPMDQTVERHLFEPFFSSESRSSGLGLYICRQLCEGHNASIAYHRSVREVDGQAIEGNEFFVHFVNIAQTLPAADEAHTTPWPTPLP